MEMFSTCSRCSSGFFYTRSGPHARLRQYCDTCKPIHDAKLNRDRVARHRAAKRAAPTPPNKRTRSKATRPARGGVAMTQSAVIQRASDKGLYAGEKQPTKHYKRAKVGLPNDGE